MNGWRPVRCERFDGEDLSSWRRRSALINEIVSNFRYGRYSPEIADEMERRLLELQDPIRVSRLEDA